MIAQNYFEIPPKANFSDLGEEIDVTGLSVVGLLIEYTLTGCLVLLRTEKAVHK